MYACMSCLLAHKHPHVSAGLTKPVSHRCQGRASQSRRRPVSGVQIRCRHAENRRLCNRVHTGSNGYSHSYRAADSFTQNSQGLFASCSTIRMWAAVVVTLSRQTDMVATRTRDGVAPSTTRADPTFILALLCPGGSCVRSWRTIRVVYRMAHRGSTEHLPAPSQSQPPH